MVLSQGDIRKLVGQKKIVFSPELEEKQYGEASVDLRLGFEFTIFKPQVGIKISVADGLGSIAGVGLWDTAKLNRFGRRPKHLRSRRSEHAFNCSMGSTRLGR